MSPTIFSPGTAALKSRATGCRDGPGLALLRGGWPPRPRLAGHQAQLPHQRPDQLQPGLDAPAGQLQSHPAVPIGTVGDTANAFAKSAASARFPCFPGRGLWPGPPFVKAGAGYPQPGAHLGDRRSARRFCGHGGILRLDKTVLLAHRDYLAKYAAAFFRNAFSISSSRFRRSSSRSRARSDTPSARLSTRVAFPVCFHPVSQGGPISPRLTGDLGDRAGSLYHHPGGFLLQAPARSYRVSLPGIRSRPFR